MYPLPKSTVKVLPVGEPASVKSLPVDKDMTSPAAPVAPEPVVMIVSVKSFSLNAVNTSLVPAVNVAVPELERVVTNCLRNLKLVSLNPELSSVNNVLTTS